MSVTEKGDGSKFTYYLSFIVKTENGHKSLKSEGVLEMRLLRSHVG